MQITENVLIAVIGCIPAVATVFFSYLSNRENSKKEVKRMEMAWEYKDRKEYKKEFAEMLSAVKELIDNRTPGELKEAIWKINLLRVQSDGTVLSLLNSLYSELTYAKKPVIDWDRIEMLLANLVDAIQKEKQEKQSKLNYYNWRT